MGDKDGNDIRILDGGKRHKRHMIKTFKVRLIRRRIDSDGIKSHILEIKENIDSPRISDIRAVLFECHAQKIDLRMARIYVVSDHFLHHLLHHIARHAVIDATPCADDLRVVTQFLRLIDEIVRIDPDAVTSDQPRAKSERIPLRIHRFEHLIRIDMHQMEGDRKLIHEGDIDIALCILHELCRFCDQDRGNGINACFDDGAIDRFHRLQCLFIHPGNDLDDASQCMDLVARIDTLRRVADLEICSQRHPRFLFKDRSADILCHPRIDRRLIDDDCAFFHMRSHDA